jgi:hypothetical protein
MIHSSKHRLPGSAVTLALVLGSMACGESTTAPRVYPGPAEGGEFILRGTVVQGGAPLEGARIVAWNHNFDGRMPDWSCWLACDHQSGGMPTSTEMGRAESSSEGRYEMTLTGCSGAHVSAFVDEGDDWVMVADTTFAYSCPQPSEIELDLVVPEAAP